jgi:hypothetical protein
MQRPRILLATFAAFLLLILFGGGTPAAARQPALSGAIADMQMTPTTIRWQVHVPNAGLVLTVAAPDGQTARQEFGAGATPTLNNVDSNGQRRADGTYMYELRVVPQIDEATRDTLRAASEADRAAVVERLRRSGALPPEQVQSGAFMIAHGAFMLPASEPMPTATAAHAPQTGSSSSSAVPQDVVQPDDLIVQGSACIGFDCVDGESFGFDTVRLKENNTRLKFDDTSTSTGFPANDWQLTANDSASGGVNKFSIDDVTGNKTPFTVIAGAPTNSLYVDSIGRIGLGTSTPGLNMHINNGNTPAIRFEQNNGGGFPAQTWDVGANEANFFVRDLTNGSLLPFRIRPGAPTSSIDIAANGNVGIGTASPQEKLHVNGNVQIEGRLVELSDVNAKRDFTAVDGGQVLNQLRTMPVSTWSYRTDAAGVRHMGPMAQDFYAAFGLGDDNRHIAALDANGVTLAAVKELDRQLQERDAQISTLKQQNADLEARLAKLEQAVANLTEK